MTFDANKCSSSFSSKLYRAKKTYSFYLHTYSYLLSNARYVHYDHQGNHCTINFDVNNKTLRHPHCELCISVKATAEDSPIGNFIQE